MPLIQVQTNVALDDERQLALMRALSAQGARLLGKPEAYVMVSVAASTPMLFGGTAAPTAFFSLYSLGEISPDQSQQLLACLCSLATKHLDVPSERTYCKFVPWKQRHLWGHDGCTFG